MKVAVVGYGKMGREVAAVLRDRHHEPVMTLKGSEFPAGCPVGIDFTQPDAVIANATAALKAGARYVIGTTGWDGQLADLERLVEQTKGGVVHAANFSLGVNLFYKVVRARPGSSALPDYDPTSSETPAKERAPSGTARALADPGGAPGRARRASPSSGAIPDTRSTSPAVRAGGIVGEHTVGFDSGGDEIRPEHRARTQQELRALGSVLAAGGSRNGRDCTRSKKSLTTSEVARRPPSRSLMTADLARTPICSSSRSISFPLS